MNYTKAEFGSFLKSDLERHRQKYGFSEEQLLSRKRYLVRLYYDIGPFQTAYQYEKSVPEILDIEFENSRMFGSVCTNDDWSRIRKILGSPIYSQLLNIDFVRNFEAYDSMSIEKIIILVKSYIIYYHEQAQNRYKFPRSPSFTFRLFQPNNYEKNTVITPNLPSRIILEPLNLINRLKKNIGLYREGTQDDYNHWKKAHLMGYKTDLMESMLDRVLDDLKCTASLIDDSDIVKSDDPYRNPFNYYGMKDRYKLHISTKEQFLRLFKYVYFIFRYLNDSDTLLLIF